MTSTQSFSFVKVRYVVFSLLGNNTLSSITVSLGRLSISFEDSFFHILIRLSKNPAMIAFFTTKNTLTFFFFCINRQTPCCCCCLRLYIGFTFSIFAPVCTYKSFCCAHYFLKFSVIIYIVCVFFSKFLMFIKQACLNFKHKFIQRIL